MFGCVLVGVEFQGQVGAHVRLGGCMDRAAKDVRAPCTAAQPYTARVQYDGPSKSGQGGQGRGRHDSRVGLRQVKRASARWEDPAADSGIAPSETRIRIVKRRARDYHAPVSAVKTILQMRP